MIGGAFRYNAENVRYHATPWMTGDGSTSSGTLLDRHGNPISSGKLKRVDAIHRTDWQGRQLLYATARTNLMKSSEGDVTKYTIRSNVANAGSTIAGFANSIAVGDNTLARYCYTGSSATVTTGLVYTISMFVQMDDGAAPVPTVGQDFAIVIAGSTISISSVQHLSGSLYRVIGTGVAGPNTSNNGVLKNGAGYGPRTFRFSGLQVELAAVATSYIPTTSTPVTVTDYTLTGPSVALGQVPVVGAVLDWDGVAKR